MRLPTGFCASLASSSALISACACVAASAAKSETAINVLMGFSIGLCRTDLRRTNGLGHAKENDDALASATSRSGLIRYVEATVDVLPVVHRPHIAGWRH